MTPCENRQDEAVASEEGREPPEGEEGVDPFCERRPERDPERLLVPSFTPFETTRSAIGPASGSDPTNAKTRATRLTQTNDIPLECLQDIAAAPPKKA